MKIKMYNFVHFYFQDFVHFYIDINIESLDGKISSGSSDNLDADKDFCKIDGVKEGLHQYYELEQETDVFSLNTGRVMAKIGVNDR